METNKKEAGYLRYFSVFSNKNKDKHVKKVKTKIKASNIKGELKITDVMLQENKLLTGYIINTSEMFKNRKVKDTDGKEYNVKKHYNILARGANTNIVLNNLGETTTGLDVQVDVPYGTTGNFKIETFYKTQYLVFNKKLVKDTFLNVYSSEYIIRENALEYTDYYGTFLSIPSGESLYNIDMNNRDTGRFTFYVELLDNNKKF